MTTAVVHRKDPYDVYIGRPSKWGNPFVIQGTYSNSALWEVPTRQAAVDAYRGWLWSKLDLVAQAEDELSGKRLGCWCSPLPCHGDVLAQVANGPMPHGIKASLWCERKVHEPTGIVHPCTDWWPAVCDCKGACACHWVQEIADA